VSTMQSLQSATEPDVEFVDEAYVTELDLAVPKTWSLFDREEVRAKFKDGRVEVLFYERWINDTTNDGIVTYAMLGNGQDRCPLGHTHQAGELYFVLEQYTDPVDPEIFIQSSSRASRAEFFVEHEMRAMMKRAMEGRSLGANRIVIQETTIATRSD
jgi:hypothetical protein